MDFQFRLNKAVFAFRRMATSYQLPFAMVAAAALLLVAVFAYRATIEGTLLAARGEEEGLGRRSPTMALPPSESSLAKMDLKVFRSSHLLAILEQGASSANIKLDEISFAIDDSPTQPYVRYRASFTVLSRYPTIRKFISEILAGSEGVVLDTVVCRREDVNAADVRCDISAYVAYQERAGG
jgi:hypothetical protein